MRPPALAWWAPARALSVATAAAILLLLATACRQASTPTGAAFFAGRTLTYIVAIGPGGGYDTYARLIAKYLDRYLPGVRVVVRNVPGAMQMIGANEVYTANPDGLTIGTFATGLIYPQITGEAGGRFDLTKMSWIGRVSAEPRVLAVGTQWGVHSIEDLRHASKRVRLATGAVGTSGYFSALIIKEALGLDVGIVSGFEESEAELAMMRGDIAGYIASPTAFRSLQERGMSHLILRIGGGSDLEEAVPAAEDLVVSPFGRALLQLVAVQADLSRPTAAPPGVPADRLEALRSAYMSVLRDRDLLADAARMQLPIDPLDGAEVGVRITRAIEQPAEVVAWLRKIAER